MKIKKFLWILFTMNIYNNILTTDNQLKLNEETYITQKNNAVSKPNSKVHIYTGTTVGTMGLLGGTYTIIQKQQKDPKGKFSMEEIKIFSSNNTKAHNFIPLTLDYSNPIDEQSNQLIKKIQYSLANIFDNVITRKSIIYFYKESYNDIKDLIELNQQFLSNSNELEIKKILKKYNDSQNNEENFQYIKTIDVENIPLKEQSMIKDQWIDLEQYMNNILYIYGFIIKKHLNPNTILDYQWNNYKQNDFSSITIEDDKDILNNTKVSNYLKNNINILLEFNLQSLNNKY